MTYASIIVVMFSARLDRDTMVDVTFAEPFTEYFTVATPVPESVALSVMSVFVLELFREDGGLKVGVVTSIVNVRSVVFAMLPAVSLQKNCTV